MSQYHASKGNQSISSSDCDQNTNVEPLAVKMISSRLSCNIDLKEVCKRCHKLPKVQFRQPCSRRCSPQPLHMPILNRCQWRCGTRENTSDEGNHGSK